jgi:hypothetical protein
MSNQQPAPSKTPRSAAPDYEVGYGKPPGHSRFKPGVSGNPRGRPKGSKNKATFEERMKAIAVEEAYREITVRDGNRQVRIPVMQAILRSLSLKAAGGNPTAQRMFVDLIKSIEQQRKAEQEWALQAGIEYKADWERELERRDRTGEIGEEPLPHPEDIHVDYATGKWEIRGPLTKEQTKLWDWVQRMDEDCKANISDLEQEFAKRPEDLAMQEELQRQRDYHSEIRRILEARRDWNRRALG